MLQTTNQNGYKWRIPISWLVSFMEKPKQKWMITGGSPIFRKPPYIHQNGKQLICHCYPSKVSRKLVDLYSDLWQENTDQTEVKQARMANSRLPHSCFFLVVLLVTSLIISAEAVFFITYIFKGHIIVTFDHVRIWRCTPVCMKIMGEGINLLLTMAK